MKNAIILLVIIGMVFTSCSKDDEEKYLSVTFDNVKGKWNIKQIIKDDGTKVDYVNKCGNHKDYIVFGDDSSMDFYAHDSNCNITLERSCYMFYINYNVLGSCNSLVDGIVTKLTANEMQIEYGELRSFYYGTLYSMGSLGVVLERERP